MTESLFNDVLVGPRWVPVGPDGPRISLFSFLHSFFFFLRVQIKNIGAHWGPPLEKRKAGYVK